VGDLTIGESEPLDAPPVEAVQCVRPAGHLEIEAFIDDLGHLVEEPGIDPACSVDRLHGHAAPEQLGDLEHALGGRDGDAGEQGVLVGGQQRCLCGVGVEAEAALLERPQRLLQALGERAADGHHLANRLHLGTENARRSGQLLERPARHLGDDVVDRRLETSGCRPRDIVGDLVERVADGEFGGDLGDREAGRL
jgi:hypothetical protein